MSVSRWRLFHWSNSLFLLPSIVSLLKQKSGNVISSLISPEDTTDGGEGRPCLGVTYQARDIRGSVKALFWIAVSLALAILVGQLH